MFFIPLNFDLYFKFTDLDVSVSFTDLEVRVDPDTGKKRRGRPPKPRADGTLPPPKRRVILGADGRPMPRGSNPIDPTTGMCNCTPAPTIYMSNFDKLDMECQFYTVGAFYQVPDESPPLARPED